MSGNVSEESPGRSTARRPGDCPISKRGRESAETMDMLDKVLVNRMDVASPVPDSIYRIIFKLEPIGWVRGWFGDSWFEARKYAAGLSAYDVRIIRNRDGEIVYERAAQTAPRTGLEES